MGRAMIDGKEALGIAGELLALIAPREAERDWNTGVVENIDIGVQGRRGKDG